MRLDGRDLFDLLLDAREQLSVAGHYFPNYSFEPSLAKASRRRDGRGYRRHVSARRRVVALVALASAAAVAVVAVAVVSAGDGSGSAPATYAGARPGRPPLSFALGFRSDPEARDLARGAALYTRGKTKAAACALRPPRLARGEGRARVRVVARRGARPRRAAREALSGERRRPAPPRPRAALGRTR